MIRECPESTFYYSVFTEKFTMKVLLNELNRYEFIEKVIIHSIDGSLYQASLIIQGEEKYLADSDGKLLRYRNKLDFQVLLKDLPIASVVLRQQSAYDEMVGQPVREDGNTLEVPLGAMLL